MRLATNLTIFRRLVCGVLVLLAAASDVGAQGGSGGERATGWFVGGAVGGAWASDINQTGSNRDPLCYPTDACFDQAPRPTVAGYRWAYDLAADAGAAFEVAAGFIPRRVPRLRMEVAFGQRRSAIDQMYRGSEVVGSPTREDRHDSTVVADTRSSIDNLTVRTLSFNAFHDFGNPATGFSPYLGAGVGPAFVRVVGVRFSDTYRDTATNGAAYDPPLSAYNSRLDADFPDTVLAAHLHAGADFGLGARTALGARLTWSVLGDIEYTGTYDQHGADTIMPMPTRLPHDNRFTGARYWTLLFTVRHVFGG